MRGNNKRGQDGRFTADRIVKIKCLNCCKEIDVPEWKAKSRKYCSVECSSDHVLKTGSRKKIVTKTCEQCGEEFSGRPSRIKLRKYCSPDCGAEAKKTRIYKTCPVCGSEFHATPSDIKIGKGKYCSHECWAKNRTMNGVVEVNCKYCNKPFNQFKYALDKGVGKYCSKNCRDLDQCGPNAVNWKGGTSFKRYCPKFNEEFKERVREFFGRTCVLCGKSEQDNKKRLSVHHVTGNKRMCCDNERHAFVSLCQSCHHRVHNSMAQYQIYFLELIEQNHGGKCYYTRSEYRQVIQTDYLNAQSFNSSFQ